MRVKSGIVTRKRRKRLLNQTEGYFGSKHTLFRTAHEQWMNSQHYAFQGRKKRKGDFRKI